MAKTRADLVELVARRFGFYLKGTATGGSATTVVDAANLTEPDDHYNDMRAYILTAGGAAPEGQERRVEAFSQATATVTVEPAFTAAVEAGDVFEILPCRRAQIVAGINAGIVAAGDAWLVPMTDVTTVTIASGDYDYSLPVGLVILYRVWRRSATSDPWQPVPAEDWQVDGTPGAQVLYLHTQRHVVAGEKLRLDYLARLSELATDAATLAVGAPAEAELVEFLADYALYFLHDWMANRAPTGQQFRARLTKAADYWQQAMAKKASARRLYGPGVSHPADVVRMKVRG
jgi:hypothetical protein